MSSGPPGENPPPPDSLPPPPQPYQPGVEQPTPYAPPGVVADAQYAMPAMVLGILSLCLLTLACFCGIGELIVITLGIVAEVLRIMARRTIPDRQGKLGER